MRILIVDLSSEHEIRVLNVRITTQISVLSGFFQRVSSEDDVIQLVAHKLTQENMIELPVYLIPPRDMVKNITFQLPRMPDKEIRKVLIREISSSTDVKEPVIFDFSRSGIVRKKQTEKIEVAAFFTKKDDLFQYLNTLKNQGLNVIKIIPDIQGFKTLLDINPHLISGRSGMVFMDVMSDKVNLNIFKHKFWGMNREFALRFQEGEEIGDEDLSRVSIEVTRTFQFFKQKNRDYNIDRIFLWGTHSQLGKIKDYFNENIPFTSELINPDLYNVKINYPDSIENLDEFVKMFAQPLAISIAISKKQYLNLFPQEFIEREKLPKRLLGLAISAGIIITILGTGAVILQNVKKSHIHDRTSIKKVFQSMSQNATTIEITKRERAVFFTKHLLLNYPYRYSYAVADFVRNLSIATIIPIQLLELDITPNSQSFSFTLHGMISSPNHIDAQSKFLSFYEKLKNFESMIQLSSSDVRVNVSGKGKRGFPSGRKNRTATGGKESELYFMIQGEVELE